jgi:hypothetical protein
MDINSANGLKQSQNKSCEVRQSLEQIMPWKLSFSIAQLDPTVLFGFHQYDIQEYEM